MLTTSCTSIFRGGAITRVLGAAALIVGLGFTQQALAVQASGSVSINPSANSLVKDQEFTAVIRVNNTSTETGTDCPTPATCAPVDATVVAGAVLTVKMACTGSDCSVEIPNTLEFVSSGINGCVSSVPEVTSCAASGDNRVLISIGSAIVVPPADGVDVATIQLRAENAILSPVNGRFFQRVATGDDDLRACSDITPTDCVTGGAQGSTSYFYPGVCDVQVDKQISCDGGTTWADATLVDANGDGTNGCSALNPNPIMTRYRVKNTGDLSLASCTLTESNGAFGDPADPAGTINPGATTDFVAGTTAACTAALPGEPDTATVSCAICGDVTQGTPITATDEATLACQPAAVRTDRQVDCASPPGTGPADLGLVAANGDGTNGCTTRDDYPVDWEYCAKNDSAFTLYDCTLVDSNPTVSPNPVNVGNLTAGQGVCDIPNNAAAPIVCSDALETSENPGGRITLTCCTTDVTSITDCEAAQRVVAFDESKVTCLAPDLEVSKDCTDANEDNTVDIAITAINTGEVNLVDCIPTDEIYLDDPSCDAPVLGGATTIDVSPDLFNLAAANASDTDEQVVTGTYAVLAADACNTTSVTCLVEGTGEEITRTAKDLCEFTPQEEGCLTRTPGFWATHPHMIESTTDPRSLNLLDIEVCGVTITNTDANNGESTTEAMCSVGKDGKILGSQLTQLVRQCTAATLNVAASVALGGDCTAEGDHPYIDELLDGCCDDNSICTGDPASDADGDGVPDYNVGYCISALDAFNNDPYDSLNFETTTGPANPRPCQDSKNNGVVVTPQ